MKSAETRIVLLTMVKNEEKNVSRLISSVKPWIDGVVLCDTGSTDKTVALTRSILAQTGLPGNVYEYAWENFGLSRTKSFESFQHWVTKHTNWSPDTTWCLLLDGDMVLGLEGGLHAKLAALDLSVGGVQLPQRNGSITYKNARLLRASAPWKCIGSTHEYWGCDGKASVSFEEPLITDIGDGGCKADKFTRDAKLLEDDLLKDPNNVRTHFYLGQTYMSLGRNEDAVRSLTRRIQLGGWEEEIYISHLYKGDCLKYLGRPLEAVEEWMKAWQLRQHRTEAALRLINHYRVTPNHTFLALIFLEKLVALQLGETLEGVKVGEPVKNDDILFVNHGDMDYPVWEELGIIAFYTSKAVAARQRLDRQFISSALNFEQRNRLTDLYRWYSWRIPTVKKSSISIDPSYLQFLQDGYWKAYNPSIRKEGDRYLVNLRHANYETVDARHFSFRSGGDTVITRNVIVEFDGDFKVLTDHFSPIEFKIPAKYIVNQTTKIHGIEDCRWLGTTSLMGTSRQFTPSELNKIVRIDVDMEKKTLVRMKPLMAPVPSEEGDCQKNWLPFIWKGEEAYVYRIDPFSVYSMKGTALCQWRASNGFTFDGLRGSAPPIVWKSATNPNECLVLVAHFSFYGGEGRRYYHRFITLGGDLKPCRVSRTFTMCDDAIQYVSGMCQSLEDGRYVITYGVNDSQAWAIEVLAETIEESLVHRV